MIKSPYTNPIPAGTKQVTFNVPSEVHERFLSESAQDELRLGDWCLKNILLGETVSNDAPTAQFIAGALVKHRPGKAWLFAAGFLGWISPLNLIRASGKGLCRRA